MILITKTSKKKGQINDNSDTNIWHIHLKENRVMMGRGTQNE